MQQPETSRQTLGLTFRAAVGTAILVTVVVIAVLAVVASTARRAANQTAERNLDQSADLVAQLLSGRERMLIGGARVFVQYPPFRATINGGPREDVLDQAISAVEQIAASWVFITDDNGVLIAKSDEPAVSGEAMGQFPLVAGALGGQEQRGYGASGDTMLFHAVALPIKAQLGAPAGVLVATLVIDSAFLHEVKTSTSSDLLFYTRDEQGREHPAASTIPGSARELSQFLESRASSGDKDAHSATLGQEHYLWMGTSLFTAGGTVVGGFLVMRAQDNSAASFAALKVPIIVALIVGALAVFVASVIVSRWVAQPLRQLATGARAMVDDQARSSTAQFEDDTRVPEVAALSDALKNLRGDLRDRDALIATSRGHVLQPAPGITNETTERVGRSPRSAPRTTPSGSLVARHISRPGLVFEPGAILANRYFIQAEVGRGGLGIVYRALDRVLGQVLAVKLLRPELALANAAGFEQLKLEWRAAQRLSHRNIVRTYDFGDTGEIPFLTMEYVDGASLASIIARGGPLSRTATLAFAKQLLDALNAAHGAGIVHGDLKPHNLLVNANGLLKVTDFGVARVLRAARIPREHAGRDVAADARSSKLTGAVVGAPEYMSPEQLIGEPASVKSDLYAVGVLLQECVTGRTPYQADTPVAFVAQKLGTGRELLSDAEPSGAKRLGEGAFKDIAVLIESLTHPRPEMRPVSAREAYARCAQL
ncbi:MAG: protein kinase [Phycisphaerae bacterium]|nr:protein kinase [Gemmatimonadaceae bacterium]